MLVYYRIACCWFSKNHGSLQIQSMHSTGVWHLGLKTYHAINYVVCIQHDSTAFTFMGIFCHSTVCYHLPDNLTTPCLCVLLLL